MLRLASLSILLEWCPCFEHGETNQNFPGFEFGGNRSLDVYRRMVDWQLYGLPDECKKKCPSANSGFIQLKHETTSEQHKILDGIEQEKKIFGIMCLKQDDFKCLGEGCNEYQGGSDAGASSTRIQMLDCVCDACPATVDVLGHVDSDQMTTFGASEANSTMTEDEHKQCRKVGPFECISASTECQKLKVLFRINASNITEFKPTCTANSYAMCPEGTGECAKPGKGIATWKIDEARSATFLWVLLAVLATST